MISVIICSIDPAKIAAARRMYSQLIPPVSFEIIHIPDATGMAEGYNRGLRESRGEVVIFSHDDVEFAARGFGEKIVGHMQHCDVLGVMGTRRLAGASWWAGSGLPYGYGQMAYRNHATGKLDIVIWSAPSRRVDHMQAMDGMFLCSRRDVAEKLGFNQQVFQRFHLYDIDFTFRAHGAGFRCSIATDLHIIHASEGKHDEQWEQDCRRFTELHGQELAPPLKRPFRTASVAVGSIQEMIEVMTPPHWDDQNPARNRPL